MNVRISGNTSYKEESFNAFIKNLFHEEYKIFYCTKSQLPIYNSIYDLDTGVQKKCTSAKSDGFQCNFFNNHLLNEITIFNAENITSYKCPKKILDDFKVTSCINNNLNNSIAPIESLIKTMAQACSSHEKDFANQDSYFIPELLIFCGIVLSIPVGILINHYCNHHDDYNSISV